MPNVRMQYTGAGFAVDFNARNRDSAEVREGLSAHAQRRAPDWNAARDADEGRARV